MERAARPLSHLGRYKRIKWSKASAGAVSLEGPWSVGSGRGAESSPAAEGALDVAGSW